MAKELDEKKKRVKQILDGINSTHEKEGKSENPRAFIAGDHMELITPSFYPCGISTLDNALGGGFPEGSFINIHGAPWCGKTSLALMVAGKMSLEGKYVAYINLERIPLNAYREQGNIKFDPNYMINIDPLHSGEKVVEAIMDLLYDKTKKEPKNVFDCIVIDSLNNLLPRTVIDKIDSDGLEGDARVGARAKLINDFLTWLFGKGVLRDGAMIITITQDRANIGGMMMGPKTVMSCGESLKYNSKVTIKLSRKTNNDSKIVDGYERVLGHTVLFSVEKNSTTCFISKGEYGVIYGVGVDESAAIFASGLEHKFIVPEKGNKFKFIIPELGEYIVKGKPAAKAFLLRDRKAFEAIRDAIQIDGVTNPTPMGVEYIPEVINTEKDESEETVENTEE